MTPIVVAILAGGRSRRMGRDKARIVWQGETLLARTVRVVREAGTSVVVVGRQQTATEVLPPVLFMPDALPNQGPLGGLVTALQATQKCVLLLACDMPCLTPEAVAWLMSQKIGPHGVAVRNGDQWEPLFSIYSPKLLPLAQEHLEERKRSLQLLINAGTFRAVSAPPFVAQALINVNTPEDLARL